MKPLEGLRAMAVKPMAAPLLEDDETTEESPARARALEHADELIAALKASDREAVADVLEACSNGYGEKE